MWEPFKRQGHHVGDLLVKRFGQHYSEHHIRFALQVLYGTLKNILLIAPGPLHLQDEALEPELLRAFLLVLHGQAPCSHPRGATAVLRATGPASPARRGRSS